MKFNKVIKQMKRVLVLFKIYMDFPHIWLSFIIVCCSIAALVISYVFESKGLGYIASIFANIFAGLLTGLVICFLSGMKQITVYTLNSKKKWLLHIRSMINDYNILYRELRHKHFVNYDDFAELSEFIYDVGAHANWINEEIIQSSFDKTLSFDPAIYCKKKFNYNTLVLKADFLELHDNLSMLDFDKPNKKIVIEYFEKVDKNLRKLKMSISSNLEEIDLKLNTLNTTIV